MAAAQDLKDPSTTKRISLINEDRIQKSNQKMPKKRHTKMRHDNTYIRRRQKHVELLSQGGGHVDCSTSRQERFLSPDVTKFWFKCYLFFMESERRNQVLEFTQNLMTEARTTSLAIQGIPLQMRFRLRLRLLHMQHHGGSLTMRSLE